MKTQKETIIELAQQLISHNSTKGNPEGLKGVFQVAEEALKNSATGVENQQEFHIKTYYDHTYPSLVASNKPIGSETARVVLNGHLDVVEAQPEQFKPYIKGSKLYGRGATDMKTGAAAIIEVFKEIAPKVPYALVLQLVGDEEIGGFEGTKLHIDDGLKAEFVIAAETTSLAINNISKGIIWLKVTTHGTTAHGAYPWNGKNAVWKMKNILDRLQAVYPEPSEEVWKTTVTLSTIETNNQTQNKVPDQCSIKLDVRFIPDDKNTIKDSLTNIVGGEADIEWIETESDHYASKDGEHMQKLAASIEKITKKPAVFIKKHGGSDIRHFSEKNMPGICFGLTGGGLHSDDEWVDIDSIEPYCAILKDFLLSL